MRILGVELTKIHIAWIGVPVVSVGVGFAGYALYKKLLSTEEGLTGDEDLELPLALEHDYGDFRGICGEADSEACSYLNELPESYFHFNTNLASYILTQFSEEIKLGRALVIGSSTGAFAFELSKSFTEVKGVEPSFTKVVTSYQFQNWKDITYYFPLEGSHRTKKTVLDHVDIFEKFRRKKRNTISLENVQIVHADPGGRLSIQIGQFKAIVFFKVLGTLTNPESVLKRIHRFVSPGGLLFMVSDYDWIRFTNRDQGFGLPEIKTTFDLLTFLLKREFTFEGETHMVDLDPISLRSCTLHNYHITTWRRKSPDDSSHNIIAEPRSNSDTMSTTS